MFSRNVNLVRELTCTTCHLSSQYAKMPDTRLSDSMPFDAIFEHPAISSGSAWVIEKSSAQPCRYFDQLPMGRFFDDSPQHCNAWNDLRSDTPAYHVARERWGGDADGTVKERTQEMCGEAFRICFGNVRDL